MSKIKSLKNDSKKKSIASLFLALILAFTFNYSPIALVATRIKKIADAYESKTTQTYYSNANVDTEKNISSGTYPSSLEKYFEGSNANFNILAYYNERYASVFEVKADAFLRNASITLPASDDDGGEEKKYENATYIKYIEFVDYDTLGEYYEKVVSQDSNNTYEDFISYFEHFVTTDIEFTDKDGVPHLLKAPFTTDRKIFNFYQSYIYLALANYLNLPTPSESLLDDPTDGLTSDTKDFYAESNQYGRVKSWIDTYIEETIAIYSYDGETQNNYVAGIVANEVPISSLYYYSDKDYEEITLPSYSYYTEYFNYNEQTNYVSTVYYSFENSKDTLEGVSSIATAYNEIAPFIKYDTVSTLQSSPLYYKKLLPGEKGYLGEEYPIYVRYNSLPYVTTNSQYDIYVVGDDDAVKSLSSTFGSLQYFHIISMEELEADQYILDASGNKQLDGNGNYLLNEDRFYVEIPFFGRTEKADEYYFTTLFSNYFKTDASGDYYKNFLDLVVNNDSSSELYGKSMVYLRLRPNTTKVVYIDKDKAGMDAEAFIKANSSYAYTVVDMPSSAIADDYYLIDVANFQSYYKSGVPLYFKKVQLPYKETTTATYTGEYETTKVPIIDFEKNEYLPTEEFVKVSTTSTYNQLYVVASSDLNNVLVDGTSTQTALAIEEDALEIRNLFVKVPSYVKIEVQGAGEDEEYTFYYKHEVKENARQIYVIDSAENAADNEVYKNLHYIAISQDKYNSEYYNYVIIGSDDENYNSKFKLYYKYEKDLNPDSEDHSDLEGLFVQNQITGYNAIYIVDDQITSSEKSQYKELYITSLTTSEFNAERDFYVQLNDKEAEKYSGGRFSSSLYYKYLPSSEPAKKNVYIYSESSNSTYLTFSSKSDDYLASDYELILPGDENYVTGTDLYYKKIRNTVTTVSEPQDSYYYFQSSSNISVESNSYYALSFYGYTNGGLYNGAYDEDNRDQNKVADLYGSLYLIDTTGVLDDIVVNFNTNGEWKQYYVFFKTNSISASALQFRLYMGNANGLVGNYENTVTSVTGAVLFDDIKLTLINETDFIKQSIDDVSVIYEAPKSDDAEDAEETEEPVLNYPGKSDKYDNEVVIYVVDDEIIKNDDVITGWSSLFNFDTDAVSNYFTTKVTEGTSDDEKTTITYNQTKLIEDYFKQLPNDNNYYDFSKLTGDTNPWHYYISRSDSGKGNSNVFNAYVDAYTSDKVKVSVVDESSIDKTDKSDTSTSSSSSSSSSDVATVSNTFRADNKVLKIENNSSRPLGVVSNTFEIEQGQFYKITVWVYSPNKEATATIKAESILKTKSSDEVGTLLSTSANVNANIAGYSKAPTNEYGWIPITMYIQGNAYGNEYVSLALLADGKQTIYFDNISIEKVTSSVYSTISSDSDTTTYVLTLSPSTSLMEKGITNGYFNLINVTDNYNNIDYTTPRTPQTWTIQKTNSANVIAGVVPTSDEYLYTDVANKVARQKTFYTEYNNGNLPFNQAELRYPNNLFAIYAPKTVNSSIDENDKTPYATLNTYKINTSSTNLSAKGVYKISFNFLAGYEFKGNMVANLYQGSSVDASKKIASFVIPYDNTNGKATWDTYSFFVETGISSLSVCLEIGIEDAVGTCFFEKVSNEKQTYTNIEAARDALLNQSENNKNDANDIYSKTSLAKYKFIDAAGLSSIHEDESNNVNGTYNSLGYSTDVVNTSSYTAGKSGVVVANFYEKDVSIDYFTVTINKITYYIKQVEVENEDGSKSLDYKLFNDSVFTKEVDKIDGNDYTIVPGKSEKTVKVVVGYSETEYETTAVNKTNYTYHFNNDVVIGDTFIEAKELDNNISENVLIIANSYTTDYSNYTPLSVYKTSLGTKAYYVLKIYVKTSEIVSFNSDAEAGLNINISSISTSWTNISTVDATNADENGFVCYRVLISTNTSSISTFGVDFSLGSEKNPCSGYAIIAGVELETFASETLFNEYAETCADDDTTIKRYYGTTSTDDKEDEDDKNDDAKSSWATFFYIFSSLLLFIVLVIALVAVLIKKHPIKTNKKVKVVDNIILTDPVDSKQSKKKKEVSETVEENSETEESDSSDTEGFV